MKSTIAMLLVAALALSAGMLLQQKAKLAGAADARSPALQFGFPDLDGQIQDVAQWRGKILLVNFWATWCPPCLREIPQFIKWQREYRDRDLQIVGIALDDQSSVAEYLRQMKVNYPMLIAGDEGGALAYRLGNIINAVPFSVVVDRQGRIVHRQPGELTEALFSETVAPLLAPENSTSRKSP
ncbi:TlpA family protein disulfide reductase [Methylomonas sp. SURF-2]|uniref:TlpA family protein disulfide reductase n=1 Tax=Methylomonas subterranea TaxID=2952225 RepID=A0ABT1TJG4_9GAMM|nr:TlpA disulfide reductase family protein [Methylomonas sp. SURF-2]MCQ8105197.1 TlpA family protein disulfide reductase [Methylomonas sp. SURF-2]